MNMINEQKKSNSENKCFLVDSQKYNEKLGQKVFGKVYFRLPTKIEQKVQMPNDCSTF